LDMGSKGRAVMARGFSRSVVKPLPRLRESDDHDPAQPDPGRIPR
jgi:hypothetical protein